MKKILLFISAFLISAGSVLYAQDDKSFEPGHSAVTIGYGYPNIYKSILKASLQNNNGGSNYYGTSEYSYDVKGYGPMFLKYEYAATSLIGIGASIGYWNTKYTQTYNYTEEMYDQNTGNYTYANYQDVTTYNFSSLSIGARLNFHFGTGEKIDPYAGLAGGYTKTIFAETFKSNNPNNTNYPTYSLTGVPVYFAVTAGIRYYFTDNIGAYAEVGLDKWSIIQGGLAIKF